MRQELVTEQFQYIYMNSKWTFQNQLCQLWAVLVNIYHVQTLLLNYLAEHGCLLALPVYNELFSLRNCSYEFVIELWNSWSKKKKNWIPRRDKKNKKIYILKEVKKSKMKNRIFQLNCHLKELSYQFIKKKKINTGSKPI